MAFIRTKNIKHYTYAYLVENTWKSEGSRQKSKKYLGRVFSFPKVKDILDDSLSPKEKARITLLTELVSKTLLEHGFTIQNKKARKSEIIVDLEAFSITQKNGKRAVLAINNGFLSTETLQRILQYNKSEDREGYLLAKYCVEAGLFLPSKYFVALYDAAFS